MKYLIILLLFAGCGETSPVNDMPEPDSLDSQAPQPVLSCYQQSNSPDYPEGMADFKELMAPEPLNNHEMNIVALTYDCLLNKQLITIDEYNCLLDDISTLRVAMVSGFLSNSCYTCGNGTTCAGQIRNNTIVLNIPNWTEDTIRHEACHRAKHMTDGDRGHDDLNFWHPEFTDCTCERVIR